MDQNFRSFWNELCSFLPISGVYETQINFLGCALSLAIQFTPNLKKMRSLAPKMTEIRSIMCKMCKNEQLIGKMNNVCQSANEHFCCIKISAMSSEIKNKTILKISSL